MRICLEPGSSDQLKAGVDARWAGEKGSKRRSRTGISIFYGNALVYYRSSLQSVVTLSSTEAEYVALSEECKVIAWLRRLLDELGLQQEATEVFQDNTGAMRWAEPHSAKEFSRSRHVDARYHYSPEHVEANNVRLTFKAFQEMRADLLPKPQGPKDTFGLAKTLGLTIENLKSEERC